MPVQISLPTFLFNYSDNNGAHAAAPIFVRLISSRVCIYLSARIRVKHSQSDILSRAEINEVARRDTSATRPLTPRSSICEKYPPKTTSRKKSRKSSVCISQRNVIYNFEFYSKFIKIERWIRSILLSHNEITSVTLARYGQRFMHWKQKEGKRSRRNDLFPTSRPQSFRRGEGMGRRSAGKMESDSAGKEISKSRNPISMQISNHFQP